MIRAVIFDLDNTLYEYQPAHQAAMQALTKYSCEKLSISQKSFCEAFEEAKKQIKKLLRNVAGGHNRMLYFQRTLELLGQKPCSFSLEMYECYWNVFLENMQLRAGVLEGLALLQKQGIRIAICTDLTAHIQHRKLRKLHISEFIDVLVTSEEAGEEKPASKIFELCLQKFALSPKEIFYVGDDYGKDYIGAKNVGILALTQENFNDFSYDVFNFCKRLVREDMYEAL